MVGPPRGPSRPTMAPQPRGLPAPLPPAPQQLIIKPMSPYVVPKTQQPPTYVNYMSLPMVQGNGSYIVSSKPPETNGAPMLTMTHRPTTTHHRPGFFMGKPSDNNNASLATPLPIHNNVVSTHAHQYLIPKPEPFAMHNYSKHEPGVNKRKLPLAAPARPTNHQRIKEEPEDEDEGEEVRPSLDPDVPFGVQIVKIDHSYPQQWAVPKPPQPEEDKDSTISSDEKVDHGDEGEETETAAEGEDAVTRCICKMDHDDGYMISCDKCYVWQHVACVLPDTPLANSAEMTYLCDQCEPRTLDHKRARALQYQRRKQIYNRPLSSDDSSSSVERSAPPPKKAVARRRAEAVPRRPNKSKPDFMISPIRKFKTSLVDRNSVRNKRLENSVVRRNKLVKVGKRGRRETGKNATPTSMSQASLSQSPVGRRTKLKRKFERKVKSKSKDGDRGVERDEERRKPIELRARNLDRTPSKSRCRLSHSITGEPAMVTTCRVPSGEHLTDLRGKYLQNSSSAPRADVLFHYQFPKDGTEVILDGSGRENVVRYARRCCTPNAQMKHSIEKGSLKLFLVATETLERGQEVTIPHGCVTDNNNTTAEQCGKDCVLGIKLSPSSAPVDRRRRSRRRTVSEESDGSPVKSREGRPPSPLSPTHSEKKMTREEKKIEQAMKIFAQMEKDTARKKDKERPGTGTPYRRGADSDKESPVDSGKTKKRRRRKRRRSCRKTRSVSGSGTGMPLISGDESDVSSGDDLASPRDINDSGRDDDDKLVEMDDAAGLLLALGASRRHSTLSGRTTPPSNTKDQSENDSSPGTPLSSACLLVAAAVGPLAPGFKFPKTKKGLMNEWLGKSPEHASIDTTPTNENIGSNVAPSSEPPLPPGAPKLSNISNRLYMPTREPVNTSVGFGKKRWLRQAISEETEVPLGSPPCPSDNVTPLKKRRLARESLTSEPPTTPPLGQTPSYPVDGQGGESPTAGSGACTQAERVRLMQSDYMAAQGIEYDTSPQRVAENLTLPRPPSPLTSPEDVWTRRGRKPRSVQRGKRKTRRLGKSEDSDHRTEPETEVSSEERSDVREPDLSSEVKVESEDSRVPDVMDLKVELKVERSLSASDETFDSKLKDEDFESKPPILNMELKPPVLDMECVPNCAVEAKDEPGEFACPSLLQQDCEPSHLQDSTKSPSQDSAEPPSLGEPMSSILPPEPRDVSTQMTKDPRDSGPPELKPEIGPEEDKSVPIKRKLSITEYLKRKKVVSGSKSSMLSKVSEEDDLKERPQSPLSDDDISPLLIPTPTLPLPFLDEPKGGRLKVEPTELERQRENLNERLRREFGLMINDDDIPRSGPEPPLETNGFPEAKLAFPVVQNLPQSAIYPVGSSNPPNPFSQPFAPPERRKFRK